MSDQFDDLRPEMCRFRLEDEGKPFPKSSCMACYKGPIQGCPYTKPDVPPPPALLSPEVTQAFEFLDELVDNGKPGARKPLNTIIIGMAAGMAAKAFREALGVKT